MRPVRGIHDRALLRALVDVVRGRDEADVIITGGTLVNVHTGEIYEADVALKAHRIAIVGDAMRARGSTTEVIDAAGRFLVPGMIDPHIHVHESQLNIVEFASVAVPHGTAGLAADLYGEMVVGGVPAVHESLANAESTPMKIWYMGGIPGYTQNLPFGHAGWPTTAEMLDLVAMEQCYGTSDTFGSRIARLDDYLLPITDLVQALGKKVTGHGANYDRETVEAWAAYIRDTDDHECVTVEEAVFKARLGLRILIREGAGCPNLEELVKVITSLGLDDRRFCFTVDVPSAVRLEDDGHIDHLVRRAITLGVEPVRAIRMATLNTAETLRIDDDHGSIAPGKWADIALVDDLQRFDVSAMVANGRLVAENGRLLVEPPAARFGDYAFGTVRLERVDPSAFRLPASSDPGGAPMTVRVIDVVGTSLISTEEHLPLVPDSTGSFVSDVERDILKIAALERVRGTGEVGVGFVRGFGLRSGALATTFNSQAENLIVVGVTDAEMALAANTLAECGGGFVVVDGSDVVMLLELPLFGLQSMLPHGEVAAQLRRTQDAARALGCTLQDPFATLGFTGCPVELGNLKISPEGIIDVWSERVVPLVVAP